MKILFISSEYHPWAKAGGLADAVAALAQALAARGHEVVMVMPRYGSIPVAEAERLDAPLGVPLGYQEEWCAVYERVHQGVRIAFLEHLQLFGDRQGVYGPTPASAFSDNARRFALLARGALQYALARDFAPEIIHAHDWPTGIVPAYVNLLYRPAGHFLDSRVVFSIHNFGYQGIFAGRDAGDIGMAPEDLAASALRFGDDINFMKSAVNHADWLVAVSPRYAQEIQEPELGFGLHREIQARADRVTGIVNGIDTGEWNPAADEYIPAPFTAGNRLGKTENKRTLQAEFGLPVDPTIPLIGMVTRLVEQKGIEPLFDPHRGAMRRILAELPVQVALLGSGADWVEHEVTHLRDQVENFGAFVGYSTRLAHLIEAGSDFFLMPSVYEPCGLNQMYSMRYGTLPIVTRTGGLADTVSSETGFFIEEATSDAIVTAVRTAVDRYYGHPAAIDAMRDAAMEKDFSWDRSAATYEELYRRPVS